MTAKKERERPSKAEREQADRARRYASVKRLVPANHVSPAGTAERRAYDAKIHTDALAAVLRAPLGSKPTRSR